MRHTTRPRSSMRGGVEGDAMVVLVSVALGVLGFVLLTVTLVEVLQRVPLMVALLVVLTFGIFGIIVVAGVIERANSTPERFRTTPPVVRLSLRRSRAN